MTAAIAVLAALLAQAPAFTSLWTGTLAGWTLQGTDADNITARQGVLHVTGPNGWLRSDRQYGDFTLRVEFRFLTDDADSGIYVRALAQTPFLRGWPNQSYQVQVRNPIGQSRFPPVGGLFRHGMPDGPLTYDPAAAAALSKGTGEWQVLEIDAIGETLTVRFNGADVMKAGNIANPRGYIGIQGEQGTLEYRRIDIRER